MIGYLRHIRGKGTSAVFSSRIGPLTILSGELYEPDGLSEKRLAKRLKKLEHAFWRRGVGRVILPDDFPYRKGLERLRPVDSLPFYRAAADVLVLGMLETQGIAPGRGRVTLAAPRLCPELQGTAERLYPLVRELVIQVPEGGEWYAGQLHRRYGLPVTPGFLPSDAVVLFGPVEHADKKSLVLYGEMPDLQGLTLSVDGLELPPDCPSAVLALLWEAGQLDRSRLCATISGETLANQGGAVL